MNGTQKRREPSEKKETRLEEELSPGLELYEATTVLAHLTCLAAGNKVATQQIDAASSTNDANCLLSKKPSKN